MKISELPEPLKSKALEYKNEETDMLEDAFDWFKTEEKSNLWFLLHESKKITPEIVKEYYKDAKEVRCLFDDVVYDITEFNEYRVQENNILIGVNGFNTKLDNDTYNYACLYEKDYNTLAEIVSRKEKLVEENTDFSKITTSLVSLLEYKNKKYGNSALEPVNIFEGKCKTGQRLDDKISRIKNNKELQKNDVADLMGYLVLTCKEFGWDNFDEFKD